jgi:hypothetical protein
MSRERVVCYKIDFCATALLVMRTHIEEIHRVTGKYPAFTKENHDYNGTTCNSLPYRYVVLSQDGESFPVCADDTSHEGFHVVVYGSGKMVLIPGNEYDEFVREMTEGKLTVKEHWKAGRQIEVPTHKSVSR